MVTVQDYAARSLLFVVLVHEYYVLGNDGLERVIGYFVRLEVTSPNHRFFPHLDGFFRFEITGDAESEKTIGMGVYVTFFNSFKFYFL